MSINPDLEQAVALVENLQIWIEDHWTGDTGATPFASLTWTPYTLSIAIDDWTLFCDQSDTTEDLNLDFLIREYLIHIRDQADSFKDCPLPAEREEDGLSPFDVQPSDN